MSGAPSRVDELIEQAIVALNSGDVDDAHQLAGAALDVQADSRDAADLLVSHPGAGTLVRLTVAVLDLSWPSDLVGSADGDAALRRAAARARRVFEDRYHGAVSGDGRGRLFAVYGHPTALEDAPRRAVAASLEAVSAALAPGPDGSNPGLKAAAAVHRGLVYAGDDGYYGLALDVAAALVSSAPAGAVVASPQVVSLVEDAYDVGQGAPGAMVVVGPRHRRRPGTGPQPGPLVGREHELARLRASWQARRGGSTDVRTVVVTGEPGIGKTRLADVFAAEVARDGPAVVVLSGSSMHTDAGLHPVRENIESACDIARDTPRSERLALLEGHLSSLGVDVSEMLARLAPVLSLPPDTGYAPVELDGLRLGSEIVEGVVDYLLACLGSGPSLLYVEDQQWLDAATVQVLSSWRRRQPPTSLSLVTTREPTTPAGGVEVVTVGSLGDDDLMTLGELLSAGSVTTAVLRELVTRSDGVPLYLEALVQGAKVEATATPTRRPPATVPEPLYEPLMARLRTAGGETAAVAGAAATIGRDVDVDLVVRAVGLAPDVVHRAIGHLVEGEILSAERDGHRFRHELLRRVAEETMSGATRTLVHRRTADALKARAEDDGVVAWTEVAHHYERAGMLADAVTCLDRASAVARQRGDLHESRAHLRRAIELLETLEPSDRGVNEIDLRLQHGFLCVTLDGNASPQAAAEYERCLELAADRPSQGELLSTLIALWAYYASRADVARARIVTELGRKVGSSGEEWFLVYNEAGFGMVDWFAGDITASRQHLEDAAERMEVQFPGDDDQIRRLWYVPQEPPASTFTHLGMTRFAAGDVAGSDEAMRRAVARAEIVEFPAGPFSLIYNHSNWVWMKAHAGDYDEAESLIDAYQAVATRHGFDQWLGLATGQRAALGALRLLDSGEHDPDVLGPVALGLDNYVAISIGMGIRAYLQIIMAIAVRVRIAAGDHDGARRTLDEAFALSDDTGARFFDAELLRLRSRLESDVDHRIATLGEALALANEQGHRMLALRVAIDLATESGDLSSLRDAVVKVPDGAGCADLARAREMLSSP